MNATAKQQLRRNVANDPYTNPTKTYSVPSTTNEDGTLNIPAQPVYLIDPTAEPIAVIGEPIEVSTRISGIPSVSKAAATNITAVGVFRQCPAGKKWLLLSWMCDLTATATVGNRILRVQIQDTADAVLWVGAPSAVFTATQIGGYDVGFGAPLNTPSTAVRRTIDLAANTNVQVRENTTLTWLKPLDYIRVLDQAAIDVADQISIRLNYIEYDV